jgi:hypothetical protein
VIPLEWLERAECWPKISLRATSGFDNFPPPHNLPDSQSFRISNEKNISTFETHPQAPVRVPRAHENQGRESDTSATPSTGPEAVDTRRGRNPFRAAH